MPTGKVDHVLYIGVAGQPLKPLGRVTDITDLTEAAMASEAEPVRISTANTGTFTASISHISFRVRIFFLTGKWLSNNWLKLHGLPMERKGRRNKKGK